MDFKALKLFLVLVNFFSILLLGVLLTYLLMGEVSPVVLGNRYATLAGAQAWADFLFASYFSATCPPALLLAGRVLQPAPCTEGEEFIKQELTLFETV